MEEQEQPEQVKSHLLEAIVVTLFCCLPLGIPALIFAAQSEGLLKAGDDVQAAEASRKAGMWCWIASVANQTMGRWHVT